MILLDTHVWIWWVHNDPLLPPAINQAIQQHSASGLAISAFSCWEVAMLVEKGRVPLPYPIKIWMNLALGRSGIKVLELTPEIAIESTQLPKPFHKDPADQIIVATSRVHQIPLATCDLAIRAYPHVQILV